MASSLGSVGLLRCLGGGGGVDATDVAVGSGVGNAIGAAAGGEGISAAGAAAGGGEVTAVGAAAGGIFLSTRGKEPSVGVGSGEPITSISTSI